MQSAVKNEGFIPQLFLWFFKDVPSKILAGGKNFLAFGINYFSLPLLFKTFFSYWRKYSAKYPRGFDLGKIIETWSLNTISRIIGAVVRFFLIVLGILFEIFIFLSGLLVFISWFALPVLSFVLVGIGLFSLLK